MKDDELLTRGQAEVVVGRHMRHVWQPGPVGEFQTYKQWERCLFRVIDGATMLFQSAANGNVDVFVPALQRLLLDVAKLAGDSRFIDEKGRLGKLGGSPTGDDARAEFPGGKSGPGVH